MQIRRGSCKSVSIYVAAEAGSGAGVDSRVGSGFEKLGARPRPGEPEVAVPNTLAGPFLFAVALLRAESSSDLLGTAEPLWKFFQQVVILKQSIAEQKNSSEPFQTGWLYRWVQSF